MCDMCASAKFSYIKHEVIARFFARHFEKVDGRKPIPQSDIYDKFVEFFEANSGKIKFLISQNAFSRQLCKIPGLQWTRSYGRRLWVGLAWRVENLEGSLTEDDLAPWRSRDLDEEMASLTATRPAPGRPRLGEEQERPSRDGLIQTRKNGGFRWSRLAKWYRRENIFDKFKLEHLVPDGTLLESELFSRFDKFCEPLDLPTCSVLRLKRVLRPSRVILRVDGERVWAGWHLHGVPQPALPDLPVTLAPKAPENDSEAGSPRVQAL